LDNEKDGEVEMIEFVEQMKDKFDIPITLKEMEVIMK
jgi:hypothetical protein